MLEDCSLDPDETSAVICKAGRRDQLQIIRKMERATGCEQGTGSQAKEESHLPAVGATLSWEETGKGRVWTELLSSA